MSWNYSVSGVTFETAIDLVKKEIAVDSSWTERLTRHLGYGMQDFGVIKKHPFPGIARVIVVVGRGEMDGGFEKLRQTVNSGVSVMIIEVYDN